MAQLMRMPFLLTIGKNEQKYFRFVLLKAVEESKIEKDLGKYISGDLT